MGTFQFELLSPNALVKDIPVEMVIVPGVEGNFTVMADHSPLVSLIHSGVVEIYEAENGSADRLFLKDGLAQVTPAGLKILAEEVVSLSDVDLDELSGKIAAETKNLESAIDDTARMKVEKALASLEALREAVSH